MKNSGMIYTRVDPICYVPSSFEVLGLTTQTATF